MSLFGMLQRRHPCVDFCRLSENWSSLALRRWLARSGLSALTWVARPSWALSWCVELASAPLPSSRLTSSIGASACASESCTRCSDAESGSTSDRTCGSRDRLLEMWMGISERAWTSGHLPWVVSACWSLFLLPMTDAPSVFAWCALSALEWVRRFCALNCFSIQTDKWLLGRHAGRTIAGTWMSLERRKMSLEIVFGQRFQGRWYSSIACFA